MFEGSVAVGSADLGAAAPPLICLSEEASSFWMVVLVNASFLDFIG